MELISDICGVIVIIASVAIVALGIAWLIMVVKKKDGRKKTGRGLLVAVGCFVVFTLVGTFSDPAAHDGTWAVKNDPVQVDADVTEDDETAPEKDGEAAPEEDGSAATESDIIVDGETIRGFYDVMSAVGIDKKDAESIKKTDDWQAGTRYSFTAEGLGIRVYCNMDGTIHSVVAGSDVALYLQGYEPWTIDNFTVSSSYQSELMSRAKDVVSDYLNYPSTAKFPWLDWTVSRYFDIYTVTSTVKAKNAFGVQSEMGFTVKFAVEDNKVKTIYCILDGFVTIDKMGDYVVPEREETGFEVEQPTDGSIRICDGQLGEYGKKVQLDSYEYDWYMVPAGKYKAVSNTKNCMVYVDKNEVTRNSEGYVEMENVATYTWSYGETIIIEVGADEHLFNAYGADYTLTPTN